VDFVGIIKISRSLVQGFAEARGLKTMFFSMAMMASPRPHGTLNLRQVSLLCMPYLQERPQADQNRRFAGLLKFDRQLVSIGNQFTLDPAKFAKWFSQWSDFFALNHSKPSIKPCSRIMEIVLPCPSKGSLFRMV